MSADRRNRVAGIVMCAVAQAVWLKCRPRAVKAGADGRSLICPFDHTDVCGGTVPKVGGALEAIREAVVHRVSTVET